MEIYILGTAHVLDESRKEVENLIDEIDPDTVCVELCDSRYQSLKDKDRWKNLDIVKVIREGKGFLLLANMILSSFQKKVGADLESAPGDEMIAAFQIAEQRNKNVVLADRDVNITLQRTWRLSPFMDKMKVLEILFESLFVKEEIKKEDVKNLLAEQDVMNEMMGELSKKLPKVKEVLIDERDHYIANKIVTAPGKKILAVVGKGHLKGIEAAIKKRLPYDPSIEKTPVKQKWTKMIPWAVGLLFIALIIFAFTKGSAVGWETLKAWTIACGTSTAIFAALVLAHPFTILASWVAAPLKLVAVPVSSSILLTLLETLLRKPRVEDFEKLNQDMQSFKGFMKNRVTKILVVLTAITIGTYIGRFIALIWIGKILVTH